MRTILFMATALLMAAFASCGGNKAAKETKAVDDDAFYSTQPVHSGQYRAVYYDIEGDNARKGRFDGRMLIALSPEQSGIYIYENGNRAKINYTVALKAPFEKGDSGIYRTLDMRELPVTVSTDSAEYTLSFEKNGHKVNIRFESNPMQTGSALEIMERIASVKK